ncbi:Tad domain-containing protein [Bacillus sp. APMAM]|uniref:Tad domain-containing protein n=1 Tax=Margalitia sp. FSL K6-0131 TaxID=2954604 RepID=UPI000F86DE45|nr:Tad domain-containing protein [Bacillus sp. APMAM]RTZ54795.1 hypothetical protein EKO25_16200 [Bacillus sp. SAJ1]
MKKYLDQTGNATFYLIWIIFIMGLMMVLILNISGVFAAKQQASNAADQASIAATDVLYDGIRGAVSDYDQYQIKKFEGETFLEKDMLSFRISEEEKKLLARGYSRNEAKIQAIDNIVESTLPGTDEKLEKFVSDAIGAKLVEMKKAATDVIQRNEGDPSKSEMTVFKNERVQVKAVVHFKGQEREKFLEKIEKDIPQKGSGPKIDFIHRLGWGEETYSLE